MNSICYIIAASYVDDMTLSPDKSDYVIAADAGYTHLKNLSVEADLVVGDFDSLSSRPEHPNVMDFPCEKDETDVMIAVREGLRLGYHTFVILGGLGGRLDHTLANIQVLTDIASKNARGYLIGDGTVITVIRNGSLQLDSGHQGVISVFCCGEPAKGVTLRGLKYPLNNAVVTASNPIGVSNEFTGGPSEITVLDGSLAVIWKESALALIDTVKEFML